MTVKKLKQRLDSLLEKYDKAKCSSVEERIARRAVLIVLCELREMLNQK